ncbi:F0F1 ATP synthase subunit B [Fusibacter bizertensis]|jgi:ATP synthase, F0 subunit b|uniref:ATP synthase subunit b n=1 Tax=Fusibacter bizertensis TaxID=1488331 RepID=A0ABT6NDQ9_9FIRM|nr:F0F1 ATP synthase subunit B [Fusibacter bizertensis]MDH8678554.1 F0F1 ATP synthase subunit B [Fusibacter bizertensis]
MSIDMVTSSLRFGLVELNWTFVFQLINTLILFLILKKFLFVPVTTFMKKREDEIKDQIQAAKDLDEDAQKLKAQYELKLTHADEEGKEIIKKYTHRAENRAFEIVKTAEAEVDTMKLNAHRELERERVKAVNELKGQISELTILAASKVVEKDLNEADHKELINKFISEVGETQWQN